jgi:NitT/TauT family transport system permease protein
MNTPADKSPLILATEDRVKRIASRKAARAAEAPAKRRMRLYVVGFYLLLFGAWQLVISLRWAPDYLFPSPFQVFKRLYELITEGFMLPSIQATLVRMAIGYSIAAAIGLVIGLVMGISAIAHACMKSLFLGLQTLPTAAWAPLSLLIFGLKDEGIYFVIVMSAAPAIAIATADGILNIPPIFLRAARTLGT